MKNKLLYKVFVFLLFIYFLDLGTGSFLKNLYEKTTNPHYAKLRYSLDSTNQEIIFLGASKAFNQFIPSVISKKTGLSSYNCGFSSQGLDFSYIQLRQTLKRYKPKGIVLDVAPNILLDLKSDQKINTLLPFCYKDTFIYNVVTKNNIINKIKLFSKIYPYNSSIAGVLAGVFKKYTDTLNGFIPLFGMLDTTDIDLKNSKLFYTSSIIDEKALYLEKIIRVCNYEKIPLALVISPVYKINDNFEKAVESIKKISYKLNSNIKIWDMGVYKGISNRKEFFYDNIHLNFEGAKIYSNAIGDSLNEILKGKL